MGLRNIEDIFQVYRKYIIENEINKEHYSKTKERPGLCTSDENYQKLIEFLKQKKFKAFLQLETIREIHEFLYTTARKDTFNRLHQFLKNNKSQIVSDMNKSNCKLLVAPDKLIRFQLFTSFIRSAFTILETELFDWLYGERMLTKEDKKRIKILMFGQGNTLTKQNNCLFDNCLYMYKGSIHHFLWQKAHLNDASFDDSTSEVPGTPDALMKKTILRVELNKKMSKLTEQLPPKSLKICVPKLSAGEILKNGDSSFSNKESNSEICEPKHQRRSVRSEKDDESGIYKGNKEKWLTILMEADAIASALILDENFKLKTQKLVRPERFYHADQNMLNQIHELTRRCIEDKLSPKVSAERIIELCRAHMQIDTIATFKRLLIDYLHLLSPYSDVELRTCDRYSAENRKGLKVCARKKIAKNTTIHALTGYKAIIHKEVENYDDLCDSFSVFEEGTHTMIYLGPGRFVNHDCRPNATYKRIGSQQIAIKSIRTIEIGEELLVKYSESYFGEENSRCECATCESEKKGAYTKSALI